MEPQCSNCKFFIKYSDSKGGAYRFYPPKLIDSSFTRFAYDLQAQFPPVMEDDWCGKYIEEE